MTEVTHPDHYLPDITITRDGKDFLVRAHTPLVKNSSRICLAAFTSA
jgi:hypothetical protein